uniref:Non-haem dioxygenase N-terminal domain-containing protein n=1 Tax=Aegilops tauschii subsp. strangulata TaxID=200361 RepID=A0A453QWL4_AEGTS
MADESWRLPNSVQQLAANMQEPPSQYLLREQELLGGNLAGAEMPEPITTIDLGLLSSSNDPEEAAKLRSVLKTWGFFQVSFFITSFLSFLFLRFSSFFFCIFCSW